MKKITYSDIVASDKAVEVLSDLYDALLEAWDCDPCFNGVGTFVNAIPLNNFIDKVIETVGKYCEKIDSENARLKKKFFLGE